MTFFYYIVMDRASHINRSLVVPLSERLKPAVGHGAELQRAVRAKVIALAVCKP